MTTKCDDACSKLDEFQRELIKAGFSTLREKHQLIRVSRNKFVDYIRQVVEWGFSAHSFIYIFDK
jgi:phosphosulfolactate synthase (CoM biosynthesis protein A)